MTITSHQNRLSTSSVWKGGILWLLPQAFHPKKKKPKPTKFLSKSDASEIFIYQKYSSFWYTLIPRNAEFNILFFLIFLKDFLKMWTIFKDFIEFVTVFLLFLCFVSWPQGIHDLSTLTQDWIHSPCTGRRSFNHWTAREYSFIERCTNARYWVSPFYLYTYEVIT